MRDESVARRYAAALFALAQRTGTLEKTRQDLAGVVEAVHTVPALRSFVFQPLITEERKKAAFQSVFGKQVSASVLSFLNLLIDKQRIEMLPEVAAEFEQQVMDFTNRAKALAWTAVPLTEREINALTLSLEQRTGKTIELKTEVDPTLIGGVLVRIGDTVYDGTVKGQLERLREHMLGVGH